MALRGITIHQNIPSKDCVNRVEPYLEKGSGRGLVVRVIDSGL